MMLKPEFSGRIELGQIIQAAILFITVVGVLGTLIGAYGSLQGRISALAEVDSSHQQQILELTKRMQQIQDDQKNTSKEVSLTLTRVSEQLTDLRILVAGIKDGHK